MRKILLSPLLACLIPACALAGDASPPQAPKPAAETAGTPATRRNVYGDWAVICSIPPGAKAEQCEANISLQPEARLPPVARVAFVPDAAAGQMRLVAIVQANLLIAPGVDISVEPDKKVNLSFKSCLNSACLADALLTAEQLEAFHTAHSGRLAITNAGGEQLGLSVSAAGLAPAIDALTQKPAK